MQSKKPQKGGNKPFVYPDSHKEKMVNLVKAGDWLGLEKENKKNPQSVASIIKCYKMVESHKLHPNTDVSIVVKKVDMDERTVRRWNKLFDTLPKRQ